MSLEILGLIAIRFESTAVHNWTVVNNSFTGCNYAMAKLPGDVYVSACTPAHPNLSVGQVHTNVRVDGNHFTQTQGEAAVAGAWFLTFHWNC